MALRGRRAAAAGETPEQRLELLEKYIGYLAFGSKPGTDAGATAGFIDLLSNANPAWVGRLERLRTAALLGS